MKRLNVKVVVITFELDSAAHSYIEETNLAWPLLVDTDRKLYKTYGMLSAKFWDIWGPKTWWAYLKEICRGRFPRKSSGDLYQRGGDVLIDPTGIVRFHHVGEGPADRPAIAEILSMIKEFSANSNREEKIL